MLSVQCFWIRITKQVSPEKKIHQEADSNENNGRHLFKAHNIPQAHAEGTKVQGSVRTAFHPFPRHSVRELEEGVWVTAVCGVAGLQRLGGCCLAMGMGR